MSLILRLLAVIVAVLLLAQPVAAAGGVRVHRLDLGASNAYLLENAAGLYLVDAGTPGAEQAVLAAMQELGREDLRLIFLTHAHFDHYGAAAALRTATGAPIAIQRADAEALAAGDTRLGMIRDWAWTADTVVPLLEALVHTEPVEADLLLDDGDSLADYGLDATVLHTPGHTPGSSSLIVEGELAFVGDLLSATGKPHAQSMYASDWSQLALSLARLQALGVDWAYSGHGDDPVSADTLSALRVPFAPRAAP